MIRIGDAEAGGQSVAVRQRMTLSEFLQLPEAEPALELRKGVISQKVSPKGPHGALQVSFTKRLDGVGEPGRRLRVFTETRIILGEESFVPDLIAYYEDRVPADADGYVPDDFFDAPDLAIEVASPGQTLGYLIGRCRDLVGLGVPVVLLVDPRPRRNPTVRVFRPGAEIGPLTGSDMVDLGDVAAGLQLTVDEIFAALRARPA